MHQFKADMLSEHILQLRKIYLSHMYFLDMFEIYFQRMSANVSNIFPNSIAKIKKKYIT